MTVVFNAVLSDDSKAFGNVVGEESHSWSFHIIVVMLYPSKILLAWAEAIGGNTKLRDWLTENGYKELGLFVFALHLKDDARDWLMQNGYPHLMATINGAEGNPNAIKWLEKHGYTPLSKVALVGDGNEQAFAWLKRNNHPELALVAKKIEAVKIQIERDNEDHHSINKNI